MYLDKLAKRVRLFKESEGGQVQGCKMVEDLLKEATILTAIELWQDDGIPESEILNRIMNRYELNRIEAEAYLAKSKVSA